MTLLRRLRARGLFRAWRGAARVVALVAAMSGPSLTAAGDEGAARVLGAVRRAALAGPLDEVITVEVRGPAGSSDVSEGRLWMDLSSEAAASPPEGPARVCVDVSVGPVRMVATRTSLTVVHANDPDRYVGVSMDALGLADLERVVPALPLPQVALAMGPERGDMFDLASLLPPIELREVSRGEATITLAGQSGSSSVTLIVSRRDDRIERFEAIVPAPSGWYEIIVTAAPTPADVAPPAALDVQGRERVGRVADLRPRGLVLVPGAELGWLHVVPGGQDVATPTTLGSVLVDRGPMVVGLVEYVAGEGGEGPSGWIERAAAVSACLDGIRGNGWSLLLVFDPGGRSSITREAIGAALERAGLGATPWAWVDGRASPLGRSLPSLDPGLVVVASDGTIAGAARMPEEGAGRNDVVDRLRGVLEGAR